MDKSRPRQGAQASKSMRQQRIYGQSPKRVIHLFQLFNQPNAINNQLRTNIGKNSSKSIAILDIHTGDNAFCQRRLEMFFYAERPRSTTNLMLTRFRHDAQHRVPEHSRCTEYQNFHRCFSLDADDSLSS
jgi:hypothetical protein